MHHSTPISRAPCFIFFIKFHISRELHAVALAHAPAFTRVHALNLAACMTVECIITTSIEQCMHAQQEINDNAWNKHKSVFVSGSKPGSRRAGGGISGSSLAPQPPTRQICNTLRLQSIFAPRSEFSVPAGRPRSSGFWPRTLLPCAERKTIRASGCAPAAIILARWDCAVGIVCQLHLPSLHAFLSLIPGCSSLTWNSPEMY